MSKPVQSIHLQDNLWGYLTVQTNCHSTMTTTALQTKTQMDQALADMTKTMITMAALTNSAGLATLTTMAFKITLTMMMTTMEQ
jgi:predicted homoserine dehydrogenase-like protein